MTDKNHTSGYYRAVADGPLDTTSRLRHALHEAADQIDAMAGVGSFEWALTRLRSGSLLRRKGWHGNGVFVYLVAGSIFNVNRPPLNTIFGEGASIRYHAHIDMHTADGLCVTWVPSMTDLLSTDWEAAE